MTRSIREYYDRAQELRAQYVHSGDQSVLIKAIAAFHLVHDLIDRAAMFSNNEILDDIVTSELRYLLSPYFLGQLIPQEHTASRKADLTAANTYYRQFLYICQSYKAVPSDDVLAVKTVLEKESNSANEMTTTQADRRQQKIWRYRRDQSLQAAITKLSSGLIHNNDDELRMLEIAIIHQAISAALQEIDSFNTELLVLDQKPISSHDNQPVDPLSRQRQGPEDWRLDCSGSALLGSGGKVLRPFIITSQRQNKQNTIFRADHSLPTMSIEEYLEGERAHGGILDSAGPSNTTETHNLKDDYSWEEVERRKAIEWDNFTENNPKGIGNTMNRG